MGNLIVYGKFRRHGRGSPDMVVVRSGSQEFLMPESVYRAQRHLPMFDDLPWEDELVEPKRATKVSALRPSAI